MADPEESCFFCEESYSTLAEVRRVHARLELDPTTTTATVERVCRRIGELELALQRHSCDAPRVPREAIAPPPSRLPARSGAALVERRTRESA